MFGIGVVIFLSFSSFFVGEQYENENEFNYFFSFNDGGFSRAKPSNCVPAFGSMLGCYSNGNAKVFPSLKQRAKVTIDDDYIIFISRFLICQKRSFLRYLSLIR